MVAHGISPTLMIYTRTWDKLKVRLKNVFPGAVICHFMLLLVVMYIEELIIFSWVSMNQLVL